MTGRMGGKRSSLQALQFFLEEDKRDSLLELMQERKQQQPTMFRCSFLITYYYYYYVYVCVCPCGRTVLHSGTCGPERWNVSNTRLSPYLLGQGCWFSHCFHPLPSPAAHVADSILFPVGGLSKHISYSCSFTFIKDLFLEHCPTSCIPLAARCH